MRCMAALGGLKRQLRINDAITELERMLSPLLLLVLNLLIDQALDPECIHPHTRSTNDEACVVLGHVLCIEAATPATPIR